MKVTLIIKKAAKRNDTDSLATVYVRVRDGRRLDSTVSTKLEVNPNQWDNTKGHLKDRIVIDKDDKAKIDGAANDIVTFINKEDAGTTELIDKNWVEMTLDKFYNPDKYKKDLEKNKNLEVVPMYEYYLEMHPLSEVRKKNNRVIIRALKRYELYIRKTKRGQKGFMLMLNDVTADTLHSIWNYFKEEHTLVEKYADLFEEVPEARKPKPRGENTLIDYFCKIRTFFIWCYDNEFTKNKPFDKFHIDEPVYGTPVYITLEERDQILNCDLSDEPKLEFHRDLFIFQSCIGCRVSDLWAMTKQSVTKGTVEYIAGKKINGDPQTLRVPLNSIAKGILEKYQNHKGPSLFPFGFQQDYNEDLKVIFKKAGGDRMVTILNPTTRKQEHLPICDVAASHMARRTFIGNMYKKVKDKSMVGMLSGHKSDSKAFDRYWTPDDDTRQSLVDLLV
jgi:site-specific recombinase XerD